MPDPEDVSPWHVYVRAESVDIGIRLSDVEFTHSVDHRAVTVFRLAPRYALSVQGLLSLIVHRLAQSSTGRNLRQTGERR